MGLHTKLRIETAAFYCPYPTPIVPISVGRGVLAALGRHHRIPNDKRWEIREGIRVQQLPRIFVHRTELILSETCAITTICVYAKISRRTKGGIEQSTRAYQQRNTPVSKDALIPRYCVDHTGVLCRPYQGIECFLTPCRATAGPTRP